MLYIFDLDGTAIDSSHRQNTLPDGSLNLSAWRENSTPEMIARDSLLPLGEQWRDMVARGLDGTNVQIGIITARVMGDSTPDYELKKIALYNLARDMGRSMRWLQNFAWFYDDNLGVIEMGSNLGINMVNSTLYNQKAL